MLLALFTALTASLSHADSACDRALRAAAAYDYAVVTLTLPGHAAITLLGEHHYKTKLAAQLGREVLAHFERVASEDRSLKSTWGGRIRLHLNLDREPQFHAQRRAEAQQLPDGRTEGSTMTEARRLSLRWAFYRAVRDSKDDAALRRLLTISLMQRDPFIQIDTVVVMTRDEAIAMVTSKLDGTLEAKFTIPPMRVTPIEDGHRADLWENLESVLSIVYESQRFKRWAPVRGRDVTITRNVIDLAKHQIDSPILTIVGRQHVPGLTNNLLDHGFKF